MGKRVCVLGATGAVGRTMLSILHERGFPADEVRALASARSAGRTVRMGDRELRVEEATPESFEGIQIALFSAGKETAREFAPIAAGAGATVIDNSSAFRMDPDCPLVVPEVNGQMIHQAKKNIIANPNCSTIQLVVALWPLHQEATIERIVVSTYQAISGGGETAIRKYKAQARDLLEGRSPDAALLDGQLAENVLMHWTPKAGDANDPEAGYQEEELKLIHETRKIFADPSLRVSPTCVRVPVVNGHSESIAIETKRALSAERARELLADAPGVELRDDFAAGEYPTPLDADGRDPVYVGRIREDVGNPGGLLLWVVSDNLRKGAALNAVQIAELLVD